MQDVVIWTGPVALYQVPGATLPGARDVNIGCFGDRSPHCPTLAEGWRDASGRMLPNLLAAHGLDEQAAGIVAIGAFSAGGSLVKRLLMDETDRHRISIVHLADASYTSSWEDAADRIPPPIEGFVRYGLDAIDGPHLLVATASPIANKNWASGVENLQRLRADLERLSGQRFEPVELDTNPMPVAAYKLGNVILAEYGREPLGHNHTAIAGQIWQSVIIPWAQARGGAPSPPPSEPPPSEPPPPPSPMGTLARALVTIGSALAGYGFARLVAGRRT
jgi:hypothetical protein